MCKQAQTQPWMIYFPFNSSLGCAIHSISSAIISESEGALLPGIFYTFKEFVFVTEATAVQQNGSDRKKTDNKKNNKKKTNK